MASKTNPPAVQDPDGIESSLSALFGSRAKISSSAVVTVNQDTQVQKYTPSGEPGKPTLKPESSAETPAATYKFAVEHHESGIRQSTTKQSFLQWHQFEEVKLPARENFKKSRREKIFAPLDKLKVELPGEVGVEGFGGVIEFAHNIFHSHIHLDFLESERDILLPKGPEGLEKLSEKELERIEVELFNVGRYNGDSEFLTAVTWSENGEAGSITLYKVEFDSRDNAIGVQPVAAMQDVPSPILVSMRTHEKIKKKVVFVPTDDDDAQGSFKWKANPSRGPTYMKRGESEAFPPYGSRDRRRSVSRDSGDSRRGPKLADADGIHATIPQFVALMHANRSILEDIESSHITSLETEDGRVVPSVHLIKPPRANSHKGENIHVAVLFPNEAEWAEEHIFWTDEDGLVEFRRKKYWDLIDREKRRRGSHESRSRSRHSTHSRHSSPDDDDRRGSRSHSHHHLSGHSESRSRSRLSSKVHSLF